jgi:TP901 family phage tail tape measure protein
MAFGSADLQLVIEAEDKASGVLKKVGGAVGKFAKIAAVGAGAAGAAIGAAGVASVKMAQGYEKAMKEVASLGVPAKEMKVLEEGVLDLSKRLGVDATEATGALYQAISAGVPPENALAFLETASKAAIAGVTDAETAVDGISSVTNAFAKQNLSAAEAADIMFATVKAGKTNFEEISASIANVAPLANAAGVSFEEVSASIATLTASGTATSVATTQVRGAIQALMKPSAELTDIFQAAGFESGEAAIAQVGFAKAGEIVQKATGGSVSEMTKLLGSIEGVQGVLGVTGDQAEVFAKNMDNMNNASGAADEAFGVMSESFDFQMNRVREAFKSGLIEVGLQILPVLTPIIEALADKLPGAITAVANAVGGFISKGQAFADIFRQVHAAIADPLDSWGGNNPDHNFIRKAMNAIEISISDVGGPLGFLIESVPQLSGVLTPLNDALSATGEFIDTKVKPAFNYLKEATKPIVDSFKTLGETVGFSFATMMETIQPLIPILINLFLPVWARLAQWLGKLMPVLQEFGRAILPAVKDAIDKLTAAWEMFFGGSESDPGGSTMFANLIEQGKELAQMLAERLGQAIKFVSDGFDTAMFFFKEFVDQLQILASTIMDNSGPALEYVSDIITNVVLPYWNQLVENTQAVIEVIGRMVDPIMNVVGALIEGLKPILDILLTEALPMLVEAWASLSKQFNEEVLPIIEEVVLALEEALVPAIEIISKVVTFLLKHVLIPYWEFLAKYIIPILMDWVKVLLTFVRDALKVISKLLKGDFAGAFEAVGTLLTNLRDGVAGIFGSMLDAARGAVRGIVDAVRGMARDVASAVKNVPVIGGVVGKLAGFQHGGQFVVGGSGGADSQTVAFRATPGETVTVSPPGRMGGGGAIQNVIVQGSLVSERELSQIIVDTIREQTRLNESVLDVNAVTI